MNQQETHKKSKPSYIYSIVSITLVLFMLGLLSLFFLHTKALTNYFKENLEFTLLLKDNIEPAKVEALQNKLTQEAYVKSVRYTSKDEAAEQFTKEFDEDFIEILGANPLPASLNVFLNAPYANADSVSVVKSDLEDEAIIEEIVYQAGLVDTVNDNAQKISIGLMVLSLVFLFIAIALINNTIKLAMYSNRFLIKSMQMVGATRNLITRPFISRSLLNGFISGLIAIILLMALLYFAYSRIPELGQLQNNVTFAGVCIALLLIGMGLSFFSTRQAVLKYLKMKLDELY